ncbi:MAG: SpoIIE family protein phosphatase [Capsulimonadales bacterium]|nr:SpoIIE family protein phosphatase [Capsulimonadales bacterium]
MEKHIEAQIEAAFGFVPPLFRRLRSHPQLLESLWLQARTAHIENPLPTLFKEKLAAFLSRYSPVPYALISHSVAWNALGGSPGEIVAFLETPPSDPDELRAVLSSLPDAAFGAATFPADGTAEERALVDAAFLLTDGEESMRQELRRLLPEPLFSSLIALMAYVRTVRSWLTALPELAWDAGERSAGLPGSLLTADPAFGDFVRTYVERVRHESRSRSVNGDIARQLAESEERYRALVETTTQIVFRADGSGYVFEASGMEEITGRSSDNPIRDFLEVMHPDDRAATVAIWQHALETKTPYRAEFRIRRRNGQYAYFNGFAVPLLRPDGSVREWVGTNTDIDREKRTEALLRHEYEKQRRIADILQRSLLATAPYDSLPGLTFATIYEPSGRDAMVGGDFHDKILISSDLVALVVGDIAGKGLEAAAHTAQAKFTLRAYLREYTDAGRILNRLNRFFWENGREDESPFLCLALAVIDVRTGATGLAVAGAEPPLIVGADGELRLVSQGDIPLGVLPNTEYETVTVDLRYGDTLVLMSDGVTEARRYDGLFGLEGVRRVLTRDFREPVDRIAVSIVEAARAHGGGFLSDDVCMALVRRN